MSSYFDMQCFFNLLIFFKRPLRTTSTTKIHIGMHRFYVFWVSEVRTYSSPFFLLCFVLTFVICPLIECRDHANNVQVNWIFRIPKFIPILNCRLVLPFLFSFARRTPSLLHRATILVAICCLPQTYFCAHCLDENAISFAYIFHFRFPFGYIQNCFCSFKYFLFVLFLSFLLLSAFKFASQFG
jgi:hypothetical protein